MPRKSELWIVLILATDAGDVESEDRAGAWPDDGGFMPLGTRAMG